MTYPVRVQLLSLLVLLVLFVVGCDDNKLRPENPVGPDDPPDRLTTRIDYRVNSTIRNLDVAYSNAVQGTTFVTTDPPWFTSFETTRERVFVYLKVEAPSTNFLEGPLVGQIFVNGELFREATARGFAPVVVVSGEVVR